jgi:hypothetical protein
MKTTKNDYKKAKDYLANNLKPIFKKIDSLSLKKDIKKKNQLLHEALYIYSRYAKIVEILDNLKSKAGRTVDQGNERVLHIALEECISKLNGVYPTLEQFEKHWNNPNKYKLPNPKKAINKNLDITEAINGIGYEKLKKFVQNYREENERIEKLAVLGILDLKAPIQMPKKLTKLSDFLKIK